MRKSSSVLICHYLKMVLPMVVRATFLLSGMLGLKFGLNDNIEKSKIIEAQVPFNITLENQTALIQLPPALNEANPNMTNSTIENKSIRGTRQAKGQTLLIPGRNSISTFDFATNGRCGLWRCSESEVCVTWIKDTKGKDVRESPILIHQCLKREGGYHTKISPTSGTRGLCQNPEEIHTIIREPRPCLNNNPPCNLIWKYKCVKASEAKEEEIHSCLDKKCASKSTCVEVAECINEPPCIPVAVCK